MYSLFILQTVASFCFASNLLPTCLLFHIDFPYQCLKCRKGFILDQSGTQCNDTENENMNCIQVSELGECMRCECGFTFSKQFKKCIPSPPHLIGCESLNEQLVCSRPKQDFLLLKSFQGKIISIEANLGSNCEIFNKDEGECQQCHSGYFLNDSNICEVYPHPVKNQFFTYFSADGQLLTRSIEFYQTNKGVFPSILNCHIHKENSGSIQCLECQKGKIPNKSRKGCFKKPFLNCSIVSDQNPNICEECSDNFHFYLAFNDLGAYCLPRSQDPTEKCLDFSENSYICLKCAKGLINTILGCVLDEQEVLHFEVDENQAIITIKKVGRRRARDCQFWKNEQQCGLCREGLSLDTQGNCIRSTITDCLILNKNNKCFQCLNDKFYDDLKGTCKFIDDYDFCVLSLGFLNECEICMSIYYFDQNSRRCQVVNVLHCSLSNGKENKCIKCINLYFLQNPMECHPIDEQNNCYQSNGITNKCLKCKRPSIKNEQGICILPLWEIDNKRCNDQSFYLSLNKECKKYSFEITQCYILHPNRDECLTCHSGFYLNDINRCQELSDCYVSDGIIQYCYQASSEFQHVNLEGLVETSKCQTNGIESTCINNGIINQTSGILIECKEQLNQCLHQKEQYDGQCTCEICVNLHYPDSDGQCQPIEFRGCLLNNGRSNKCILCKSQYEKNLFSELCELRKDLTFFFCEQIEENICIKCQNLYYLYNKLCLPVNDPDCIDSGSILNTCIICKVMDKNFNKFLEFPCFNPCQKYDLNQSCTQCMDGYILNISMNQKGDYLEKCEFNNNFQMQKFSQSNIEKSQCEPGYHLVTNTSNMQFCIEGYIENCKAYNIKLKSCSICEEGFILLSDKTCYQIHGCLKYTNECLKCEQNYILLNGNCLSIPNCVKQQIYQCQQCVPGYKLKYLYGLKVNNTFLNHQLSSLFDICEKIPNCSFSLGIIADCLICNEGFTLIQGTCLREEKMEQNCLKQDENGKCVKCENLFFLEKGICIALERNNCSQSDGIFPTCLKCIFSGYGLNESGQCKLIDNCIVSNGIETCIICEDDFFLDIIGKCQQILVKIENCLEYSFDFQDILQFDKKGSLNLTNYQQFQLEEESSQIDIGAKQSQYCVKCSNFYQLIDSQFLNCELISKIKTINCFHTDGIFQTCQTCNQGAIPQQSPFHPDIQCQLKKRDAHLQNIGCQLFSVNSLCMKCFNSFFLDFNFQCQSKNLISKCLRFNPTKDECQICKSGYFLKKINQNSNVCIPLEEKERVKDCEEYQENSSKCIKCKKYQHQDIAEFILNKINNRCDSIIHFMCKEFDQINSKCLISFILNCEEYHNSSDLQGCKRCSNGCFITADFKCKKHKIIKNCIIYSQTQQNSCKQCQQLFFLSSDSLECFPNFTNNCEKASTHLNQCLYCSKNFVKDKNTERCISSQINHCEIVEVSGDEQRCFKCKQNFIVSKERSECLFKQNDKHCIQHSDKKEKENIECIECAPNYFLSSNGTCILETGICQIQNCAEYDKTNSNHEEIMCQQCLPNYYKNGNGKCLPLDPDSIIENETKQDINQNQEFYSEKVIMIIGLVVAVIFCLIGYFIKKRKYLKRLQQQKENEEEIDEIEEQEQDINSEDQMSYEVRCKQEINDNQIKYSQQQSIELQATHDFI